MAIVEKTKIIKLATNVIIASMEISVESTLGNFFDSSQLDNGVKSTAKNAERKNGIKRLFPTIKRNTKTMMKTITDNAFK